MGERSKGEVFYSQGGWTLHVSGPAQGPKNLLWQSNLSIRSGTCVRMGSLGGIESSRFHILLLLQ